MAMYDLDSIEFERAVLSVAAGLTFEFNWEQSTYGFRDNSVTISHNDSNDSSNSLLWPQIVRSLPGVSDTVLLAATADSPYHDPLGAFMKDVSSSVKDLDHVEVMNCGIYGPLCK
ncbi:hypothetical protein K488DRAFT_86917 [Vararia minispora EC-137]|uniref:Uncharacterized protein n=1 Tax=Vararia minispora EC-137 TaxID=1314806 RepID=A0ACB8QI51_9AGAM|nr:hypothetical protein K488DRAFT_86917 [Vararia minispora EC-137]